MLPVPMAATAEVGKPSACFWCPLPHPHGQRLHVLGKSQDNFSAFELSLKHSAVFSEPLHIFKHTPAIQVWDLINK